jgi:hypothetical protein
MTRRTFAKLSTIAAGVAGAPFLNTVAGMAADDTLKSEFLLDLVIETGSANRLGTDRLIVPVSGGTFEGPRLKGTIVGPGRIGGPRRSPRAADRRCAEDFDDVARHQLYTDGRHAVRADLAPVRNRGG